MKGFCPLASGSKGNAIYLGTSEAKVLIDAGLSAKKMRERLERIAVSLEEIEAIIITHEHNDHISGLKVLNERMGIPIFANRETAKGIYKNLGFLPKCKIFSTGETFSFKDIEITPFSVHHDTLDPVGLRIHTENHKIGICTDLGFVSTVVRKSLLDADLLYLEANHCPDLVMACPRPNVYKKRVLGRQGHLSNDACGELLTSLHNKRLKRAYLAHLSSECNAKEIALKTVSAHLEKAGLVLDLFIAHQEENSEAYLF